MSAVPGAARRKGPPPWRAVHSRTCLPVTGTPDCRRPCIGPHHHSYDDGAVASLGPRPCPWRPAGGRTAPRCGVRRRAVPTGRRTGRPIGRPLVRPSAPPRVLALIARRKSHPTTRQILLYIAVGHLVAGFLMLLVYLGRHAGT
ncbi:DUF6126 family protein [Streptomyces sp. NPDC059080]|uniref:DUF6126 family protein n=1 Tax=Streptomyces sp. NPDC059080 TaxID=3346718 RepID=UPI0036D18B70